VLEGEMTARLPAHFTQARRGQIFHLTRSPEAIVVPRTRFAAVIVATVVATSSTSAIKTGTLGAVRQYRRFTFHPTEHEQKASASGDRERELRDKRHPVSPDQ